jgi:4-hydroxybenzoate polyprenyltransferase
MVLLQFAIGAVNDMVDAPFEGDRRDKPIVAGDISVGAAVLVAAGSALCGVVLAALSGIGQAGLATLGLGVGLAYDLRLKRTLAGWLPLAVGLPLLVLFAWSGAPRALPPEPAVLVPCGILAGAALALANGLVDPARDQRSGTRTPVVDLGPRRAWRLGVVLEVATLVMTASTLLAFGAAPIGMAGAGAGGILGAAGLWLGRDPAPGLRERGWELQAVATAVLGAAWVAGIALR